MERRGEIWKRGEKERDREKDIDEKIAKNLEAKRKLRIE